MDLNLNENLNQFASGKIQTESINEVTSIKGKDMRHISFGKNLKLMNHNGFTIYTG